MLEAPVCNVLVCLHVWRFADDYRVALQQSYVWTIQEDVPDAQGFFARPRRRRQNVRTKTLVHTLSFWCLNPSVVSAWPWATTWLKFCFQFLPHVSVGKSGRIISVCIISGLCICSSWQQCMCVLAGILWSGHSSTQYSAHLWYALTHGVLLFRTGP